MMKMLLLMLAACVTSSDAQASAAPEGLSLFYCSLYHTRVNGVTPKTAKITKVVGLLPTITLPKCDFAAELYHLF